MHTRRTIVRWRHRRRRSGHRRIGLARCSNPWGRWWHRRWIRIEQALSSRIFRRRRGRRNASRSHRGLHRVWCRNRAGKACRAGFHRSSNVRAGRRAHRRRYPSRKRRGIGNDIFRRRLRWYSSPGSFPVRRELGLLSRLHRSHRRFQTLPRSRTNPRRRKCPPFPTRLPDCCQRFRRPYHPRIYRPRHRQRCPRHHRATRQASCHRRPSRGKGFGGRCRHCYRTRDKYREGM